MEPFNKLTGVVAALDRQNVDTDQIIPAVHLKAHRAHRLWAIPLRRLAFSPGRTAQSGL